MLYTPIKSRQCFIIKESGRVVKTKQKYYFSRVRGGYIKTERWESIHTIYIYIYDPHFNTKNKTNGRTVGEHSYNLQEFYIGGVV